MSKTNLYTNMDELEKLIKSVRTSMNTKKKLIKGKTLDKINSEFLDASYIERTNLAKSKIMSKIKKLNKIQETLNEFTQDIKTFDKLNKTNKLLKNELLNFQSSGVIKKSSKKTREERILNSSKSVISKVSKFKGIYQNITYKIGYQVLNESLPSQMYRELIKTENILSNVVKNRFENRDKSKNLLTVFHVEYIMKIAKVLDDGKVNWNFVEFHCSSTVYTIKSENLIGEMISDFIEKIIKYIEEKVQDSSFIFYTIKSLNVQYIYKEKTKAGSYLETPLFLQNRKSILNVKNNNDRCIDYAITGFLMLEKNKDIKLRDRVSFYENSDEIKILKIPNNITYPIDINKDIPKYEKLNNMKINVFIPFENKIIPLYNTSKYYDRICNLILFEENEKKHICLITNIDNLLGSTKTKNKNYHCTHCLGAHFETKEKLDIHFKNCIINESSNAVYPEKGVNDKLFYNSFDKEFKHPFYCSLDFEATLEKNNDYKGNTNRYQHHRANSYGLKYNCIHEQYSENVKIFGNKDENEVMKNLMKDIEGYARKSYKLIKQNEKKYINITQEEINKHNNSTNCECCNNLFCNNLYCKEPECMKDYHKTFHHDHITGKYISTLCNTCNLKMQYKKFLPVYVHNLKNYDSHFIVRALNKYSNDEDDNITCIPNNEEKYISFSKNIVVDTYINKKGVEKNIFFEIRFLDTFSFMSTSLSELVDNLRCLDELGNDTLSINELRTIFKNTSDEFINDEQFKMMIMKGVYPYDFIDNYDKLHYPRLPDKKEFYSKLNNAQIDDKEYKRALNVWDVFQCKTFIDYHNIYLKSDVLLLSDIWDNFREVCYKNYELDCCYFYTAPGLSWCAWMKVSLRGKEKIELITDPDMYLLFEKSIRGGLSQISHRYAEVKDPDKDFITYLDANALYSHAMMQYLPVSNFEWDTNEWTKEKILSIGDKDNIGYLFEVDLSYDQFDENNKFDEKKTKEIMDLHNGYCLAPENIIIKNEMLNKFQTENRNNNTKISKLTTNFFDKLNYGVSYRTLKLYLELGLTLKKVHRVVKYNQKPIMEKYIEKNTELRQKSKTDFEKDFFKLLNNAIFGKSMENVRNRINFRLIDNEKSFDRITSSIKKITEFGEDEIEMLGVHLLKKETLLNKPIFLGQCILDQSKHLMYNFHYNFMLKQFKREDIDLLFTDTDSLCYNIRNKNPYDVFLQHKDKFDNSEYPKDHPMYDSTNLKVCGKFKNEAVKKGKVYDISHFIGLRSKVYAYKVFGGKEDKRLKGVKKSVCKKDICFNDYYNTNFTKKSFDIKQNGFRSYKHQIYTETVSKIALSCYDDKVYLCDNMINTYSLGHYRTFNKSSQN